MTSRPARLALAGAMACVFVATTAAGQTAPGTRLSQGLFGGVSPAPGTRQTLGISISGLTVAEHNGDQSSASATPSIYESSGVHHSADAAVTYGWRGQKLEVGANAGGALSYYPTQGELVSPSRYVGAGIGGEIGQRVRILANQTATCAPARLQGLFPEYQNPVPGDVQMFGPGQELDDLNSCAYETGGQLTYGLGRRSSIDFTSSVRYTTFDAFGYQPLHAYSGGAHFVRSVSRTMKVRLGYTRHLSEYLVENGPPESATTHDLDIGVDYERPLSFSRRTRLTFSTGSTIVERPITATQDERKLGVTGTIGLSHEFGRSWHARGVYTRGVSFIDGFAGPVLGNGASVSLDGLLTRRIDFSASAGLSFGNLSEVYSGQDFSTYAGSARVRYGLTRRWALFGDYTFLFSDLGTQPIAVFGSSAAVQRNAVRAGLTLWIPVLKR